MKQLLTGVALGALVVAAVMAGTSGLYADTLEPGGTHADNTGSNAHLPPAHLWRLLADDIAARLVESGSLTGRIYVAAGKNTPFDEVFRDMLITALVEQKAAVVASESFSDRTLVIKSRAIYHTPANLGTLHPAVLIPLAGGILYVIRDAYKYGSLTEATAAALIGSLLWDRATAPLVVERFPSEVAITTSLQQKGRYLARTTDVYFLPGQDTWLYTPPPKPTAIPVEG